tara:strand:+ start:11594 stop:12610 length:1017 start_codon:yes stop_codon:yes gene_type:complete
MGTSAVSRLGQINSATGSNAADNALFLKQFSGQVITVFDESNVMLPTTTVRTITSGKSAQFPATSVASAGYHTPGEDILADGSYLSAIKHNEIIININDLLVSSVFVDSLEEAKNHYDVRSEYAKQMARALSAQADNTLIYHAIAGARVTTDRFGATGASALIGASEDTGVDTAAAVTHDHLVNHLFAAAEHFDSKDVPSEDRYCVTSPAQYYKLIEGASSAGGVVLNRDFGNEGNGSMASGSLMSVAGIKVLKSNHIPTADYTIDAQNVNLSGLTLTGAGNIPVAICYHRSALGTVKLKDLKMEVDYRVERQGHLLVCSFAFGHNVLRNECLYEIKA